MRAAGRADKQRAAIAALLWTLSPAVARLPDALSEGIPPRPPGFPRSRETFASDLGPLFDPFGAAQSAISLTLEVLLEKTRAARLIAADLRLPELPGFDELSDKLMRATWYKKRLDGVDGELQRACNNLVLERLLLLAVDPRADRQVRALALDTVKELQTWLGSRPTGERNRHWRAHYRLALFSIEEGLSDPSTLQESAPVAVPPGAPLGGWWRDNH